MCGIAGFLSPQCPLNAGTIGRMTASLRHRGPDSEGYALLTSDTQALKPYSGPETYPSLKAIMPALATAQPAHLALGFRRLAIIDLSDHGHQPMLSADVQVALTFNGEIYNYQDLRKELAGAGYPFQSQTDSEVILAGYLLYGIGFMERLAGMFAIAIYDHRDRQLYLIRDRLGIKPLYYAQAGTVLLWGSEQKAILASKLIAPRPDWTRLALNFRMQAAPDGCLEDMQQVPPGAMLIAGPDGNFAIRKYWTLPQPPAAPRSISFSEAAEELQQLLQHIAREQTISYAPLISLMSGGIDSTLVTALCSQARAGMAAYTLSVGSDAQEEDEEAEAVAAAQKIGVGHIIHQASDEQILEVLTTGLRVLEQPYSQTLPELLAARHLSRLGFRTAMSGLGGDELFGGYPYYRSYPRFLKRQQLRFLLPLLPPATSGLRKAREVLALRGLEGFYAHHRHGLRMRDLKQLFPALRTDPAMAYLQGYAIGSGAIPEQISQLDIHHNVGVHHAFLEDQAAMSQSIETRYPLLDHRLVEWALSLPPTVRFSPTEGKPLLRAVARPYLAPENLAMPKKGFNLPLWGWYRRLPAVRKLMAQKLSALEQRGVVPAGVINQWKSPRDAAGLQRLWLLVSLEGWLEHYVDDFGG